MWNFKKWLIYQKYNYYRRFRPWYGYPNRWCFIKRYKYYPWFLKPWTIILCIIGFLLLLILI